MEAPEQDWGYLGEFEDAPHDQETEYALYIEREDEDWDLVAIFPDAGRVMTVDDNEGDPYTVPSQMRAAVELTSALEWDSPGRGETYRLIGCTNARLVPDVLCNHEEDECPND